jgi:hypothetical protein
MNISTGGPHILFFERDQQLAGLLMSECQLAGYECHVARTAVEVFDAIARQPIRLVLVNLAQAAAARREFWVALDTQRRGRGIQVLTLRCINIAGYGPQDPEDRPQNTTADLEIDGMTGVMNLVEAIRTRVPSLNSNTNTMPRMPRMVPPFPPAQPSTTVQRATQSTNTLLLANEAAHSTPLENAQPSRFNPTASSSTGPAPVPETPAPSAGTNSLNPLSYTDKIRAVLYPNQRSWLAQGNTTSSTTPENRPAHDPQSTILPSPPLLEATMLQHLATGQTGTEGLQESGLAQLSRMLQERQSHTIDYLESGSPPYTYSPSLHSPEPAFITSDTITGQIPAETSSLNYSPLKPWSPPENVSISAQPLRASPIQDMPVERATSTDSFRRSELSARTGHGQISSPTSIPPLASISTQPPVTPAQTRAMPSTEEPEEKTLQYPEEDSREYTIDIEPAYKAAPVQQGEKEEPGEDVNNAMLLDIMQSLPPMPPAPPQPLQRQVLSGRVTRSLGSVLLEGHLVPQSRLEVAQNVQRMLRGVDLNYHLGEILLMFKLLTPDQLLAASLVSHGLITTTQIGALGRIRQELHAIGLEYDLENLLILFRILTPEQLREVRASWQG